MEDDYPVEGGINYGFERNYLPVIITAILALGVGGYVGQNIGSDDAKREIRHNIENTLGETPSDAITEIVQRIRYNENNTLVYLEHSIPKDLFDKLLRGEELEGSDWLRIKYKKQVFPYGGFFRNIPAPPKDTNRII